MHLLSRQCVLPASMEAGIVRVAQWRGPPIANSNVLTLNAFPSVMRRTAASLHPRNQLPYMLSRIAASHCIQALAADSSAPVLFNGSRQDALAQFQTRLSLSHEDTVGAAVAWRPTIGGGTNYAIDVTSVIEVMRLKRRFPQFGRRWLPQCCVVAPASVQRHTLEEVGFYRTTYQTSNGGDQKEFCGPDKWWLRLPLSFSATEQDVYEAVVLSQHWAIRECAVKLLGVPSRSFDYSSLTAPSPQEMVPSNLHTCTRSEHTSLREREPMLPWTSAALAPGVVYRALVQGTERRVFEQHHLSPHVVLYSWVEWAASTGELVGDRADGQSNVSIEGRAPHVVVVASCCCHHERIPD